ncbi:hypothetical protein TNCV_2985261 [Trichonephila clavipes]|nr:hypothetical protein TNCV_2985261 [Trichonephila clavipes]
MVPNMVAKSPKLSPKLPNWSSKMMPTWLYRQDIAKFPLNHHYNETVTRCQILVVWGVTPDFPPEHSQQLLRCLRSTVPSIAMQEDDTFTQHAQPFASHDDLR